MATTRVYVVAKSSLAGEAWRALLATLPGIEVVGTGGDPKVLAAAALPEGGGCVLVDVERAADVVRTVGLVLPGWGVLALTDSYTRPDILELLSAGALGVISRDSRVPELASGLVAAARGEFVLPGSLAGQVLAELMEAKVPPAGNSVSLTARETEVLRLLAQGWTNKVIAQALLISVRTVEAHLRAIYDKLGVASRTEAVLWAIRQGSARRD